MGPGTLVAVVFLGVVVGAYVVLVVYAAFFYDGEPDAFNRDLSAAMQAIGGALATVFGAVVGIVADPARADKLVRWTGQPPPYEQIQGVLAAAYAAALLVALIGWIVKSLKQDPKVVPLVRQMALTALGVAVSAILLYSMT